MVRKEFLLYFTKAGISSGSWKVTTHDRKYQCESLGIKRLQKIEKYEVDVLGSIHRVAIPETRQVF